MVGQIKKISDILKSLIARDQEELSLLQWVIEAAQSLHGGSQMDMGLQLDGRSMAVVQSSAGLPFDIRRFLEMIPEDASRYFNGLIEALEVYESIHGEPVPVGSLTLSDKSVLELRQIRDLCLEEGLRSIY